jgi:hypothetical protein
VSTWATPADLADKPNSPWPQAPTGTLLVKLLDAAEEQCRAFAPLPVLVEGVEQVTESMRLAVIYQARELWAAAKREGDTIVQGDAYVVRARPLVGSVKQLLRPSSPRRGRLG